ncbi:MAG: AsmA family protein [Burkholderiales bacterium]|nr:AsmA family protein [Burkholderiales bacterium]
MRFLLRRLIATVLTLGVVVVAAAALLLAVEFRLPLDVQRVTIAAAVSKALGAEVRITGPLWLISGGRPGVEVGGLHFARGLKDKRLSADLELVRVRLPWSALLSREIRLSEATVTGAKLCVSTATGAPRAERSSSSAQPGSAWRLTGIDTLRIELAALATGPDCKAMSGKVQLRTLTLSASGGEALQIAAAGAIAGVAWQLDLSGPRLKSLLDTSAPVPFKLVAESAGGKLSAEGKLLLSPYSADADVVFDSPQFVAHVRPSGAPFKDFGPLSVRAHVLADANRVKLRLDEARLSPGAVSGEFSYDWSQPLPRLEARARTDRLDTVALQRWLQDSIDVERLHPGRLQRQIIASVRASAGSLVVDVGQVAAGRAVLDAALIDGSWDAGKGRGSFGARWDKTRIKGTFDADVRDDVLSFAANAATGAIALQQKKAISATAGRIDAQLSARGRLGVDLDKGVRASIEARNVALSLPRDNAKVFAINLDTLRADWQAHDTLRMAAAGTALGERFDARVEGADAQRLLRGEPWQLNASGAYGAMRLKSTGRVALREGKPLAQLDVTAASDALGSLVPRAIAKLPLDVRGRIELEPAAWRVDLASLRLGKTQGAMKVSGSLPFAARPLAAQATFELLDLRAYASEGGGADIWERQWLPGSIALPDAELALQAARVATPRGEIAKVELNAQTRAGRLEHMPFALEVDGAAIRGSLAADLRQEAAQVSATIEAAGVDRFIADRDAAEGGVRIKVGSVKLGAQARGNRLRELAGSAELRIELRDVYTAIERSGKDPKFELNVSDAELAAAPGSPTRLKMSGTFADQPLSIEADSGPLASWLPAADAPRPFSLSGRVAGLDLAAKGEIPVGGAMRAAALEARISADSLDAANALFNSDLPPVGPFVLEAVRRKSDTGVAADIKLALGESRIAGQVASRYAGNRPAFDIDLKGALLRLEDLGVEGAEPAHPPKVKRRPSVQPSAKSVAHAQALLDALRDSLRGFDARLRLALPRISAGGKEVGQADVLAQLDSGRLRLAPLKFLGPLAGSLDAELEADMSGAETSYRLATTIERLRYGEVIKKIDPKHSGEGELSLRLELSGRGALDSIAATVDGSAGVIIFPSGLSSAWLDKLGGGLLRNVGRNLDSDQGSKLNCAVATFQIEQGRAKSTALMLDSTRVRAAGELDIDFVNENLQGQIAPKSKRPEMFTKRLPLVISGTFAQPRISLLTGGLAVTAARYYYFAYAFLFDAATSGQLAEDGRPDCIAAYERLAK